MSPSSSTHKLTSSRQWRILNKMTRRGKKEETDLSRSKNNPEIQKDPDNHKDPTVWRGLGSDLTYSVFLWGTLRDDPARNPGLQGLTRRKKRGRRSQKYSNEMHVTGPKNEMNSLYPFSLRWGRKSFVFGGTHKKIWKFLFCFPSTLSFLRSLWEPPFKFRFMCKIQTDRSLL